jgi:hypothetical protein
VEKQKEERMGKEGDEGGERREEPVAPVLNL